jgi:hypothetical protein
LTALLALDEDEELAVDGLDFLDDFHEPADVDLVSRRGARGEKENIRIQLAREVARKPHFLLNLRREEVKRSISCRRS